MEWSGARAQDGRAGDLRPWWAKGYSSASVRRWLRAHGIRPVIPTRSDQPADPGFDRTAYRERNVVERTINRLKQFRGIASRYDKLAAVYQTHVTIASIVLWL